MEYITTSATNSINQKLQGWSDTLCFQQIKGVIRGILYVKDLVVDYDVELSLSSSQVSKVRKKRKVFLIRVL